MQSAACVLSCSVEICCFGPRVLRVELASGLECFALLDLNALQALLGLAAGFGVGHAKHVVCLDTLVRATVTWNRFAQSDSLLGFFVAVERFGSINIGLDLVLVVLARRALNESGLRVVNSVS